jgi:antitoxin MazE
MRVIVKKRGNNVSVRIPSVIMRAAHLRLNQVVDVREEAGRIIIEPVPQPEFDLESLVAEITDQNLHQEVDFGTPVGNEAW